jgi:hypothetical protein
VNWQLLDQLRRRRSAQQKEKTMQKLKKKKKKKKSTMMGLSGSGSSSCKTWVLLEIIKCGRSWCT